MSTSESLAPDIAAWLFPKSILYMQKPKRSIVTLHMRTVPRVSRSCEPHCPPLYPGAGGAAIWPDKMVGRLARNTTAPKFALLHALVGSCNI